MSLRIAFQRMMLASALAAGWANSPAAAQSTPTPITITRDYMFPPVTLASTETARIIVFNAAVAPTATPATGTSTLPSCTGMLAFIPSTGTPTTPVAFTVGAGQFATANFAGSSVSTSPEEVVGKVTVTSTNAVPRPACNLLMSLEVFDSSGVGHVILTNPMAANSVGPAPIPQPLPGQGFGGR